MVILYSFYKNITFVFTLFFFGFSTGTDIYADILCVFMTFMMVLWCLWCFYDVCDILMCFWCRHLCVFITFMSTYIGVSGTTLYESYLGTSWNVLFTLLPIVVYGIVEKDIRAQTALMNPSVYVSGQEKYDILCVLFLCFFICFYENYVVIFMFVFATFMCF